MSENGILDFIVIIEKSPAMVNLQYGKVTGNTQLPPLFSFGVLNNADGTTMAKKMCWMYMQRSLTV